MREGTSHILEMAKIRLRAKRLPVQERSAYIAEHSKEIEWMRPVYIPTVITPTDIQWQVCNRKDLPAPSAAEELIMQVLGDYRVDWYREVEFLAHRKSEFGLYRYDFFLPSLSLVIEYDSVVYHESPEQLANDAAKDMFCRSKGIDIVRLNKKHYYHMREEIGRIMGRYGAKKKNPGK